MREQGHRRREIAFKRSASYFFVAGPDNDIRLLPTCGAVPVRDKEGTMNASGPGA
jgi:hypothetical protein